MKKKLAFLIAFVAFSHAFAQDMAQLKTAADKMYAATHKMDFEKIMDYSYPKMFELNDRATLTEAMKNAFDNDNFKIMFPEPNVTFNFGEIKAIGKQKFCVIKYRNKMKMKMLNELDEESTQSLTANLLLAYEKADYDDVSNTYSIEGDATMVAIADDLTKNQWRFLNYDAKIFKMMFGENIKNALGL